MSVVTITGLVAFKKLLNSKTDDWVDKLNHVYTVSILVILGTVVTTTQLVGEPIYCWVPAEFTHSFEAYTKYYCWIKNTYFIPISDTLPVDVDVRSNAELTYYQWVPLILLFMAFMFKFPNVVWKMLNTDTGFNLSRMIAIAEKSMMSHRQEREQNVKNMAIFLDMWLRSHHNYQHNVITRTKSKLSRVFCFICNKREGKYLTALYFNIKTMYVINVITQFYILNWFLDMGYNVLDGLTQSENWRESPRFPRVTLCDFRVRLLQNIQRYTVQCVLPLNLFNERIFIFLWFWYFFIAVLSCVNLFKWFLILVMRKNNYRFIRKYLKIAEKVQKSQREKRLCRRFAENYLRDDGCFVLRLLAINSSELVVIDLVEELWNMFKTKQEEAMKIHSQQVTINEYPDIAYIDQDDEQQQHTVNPELETIAE